MAILFYIKIKLWREKMIEVKFRGKNKTTKQWVYGDLIHRDAKCYIGYQVKDGDSPSGDGYVEREIDSETLGQYIGIRDKLNKEVFQGDIVRVERQIYTDCSREIIERVDRFVGEIILFQYSWCIAEKVENNIRYHFLWTWNVKEDETHPDTDFMEVIGNIHNKVR